MNTQTWSVAHYPLARAWPRRLLPERRAPIRCSCGHRSWQDCPGRSR